MGKLRHNKKRNVGLVYELLVRTVSQAAVENDRQLAAKALGLIGRHFANGSTLKEELDLHRSVFEARGISVSMARRMIDELRAAGARLRARPNRDTLKSSLIREMHETLGRDFLDRHIPEYLAHASIGLLLSRSLSSRLDESMDYARIEEALVGFLSSPAPKWQAVDPEQSMHAYRIASTLYEKQYGKSLVQAQHELLREFVKVNLGGPEAPFQRLVERQRGDLVKGLKHHLGDHDVCADPKMSESYSAVLKDLSTVLPSDREQAVEKLMLVHDLLREVGS